MEKFENSEFNKFADEFATEMYSCRDPRDRIVLAFTYFMSITKEERLLLQKEIDRRFPDGIKVERNYK